MKYYDYINEREIRGVIKHVPPNVFNTIEFIDHLIVDRPDIVESLKLRYKRWRPLVGKILKRFSRNTREILHASPKEVSPALWKKV